ncbi:hypothetical protein MM236_01105 [Belliella sp. DSM 107340]|uniref:Uncharacterized protein n=1 Tax=Belliella calami TaxID=2923436 RepID=A0ABS9UIW2_9BACT|nr:hypothetical protein [Belliella calami]MCH7396559.1 hypothetical protein [Belliella calami]
MNKKIKLLSKSFEFRKSAYAYKNFEDRNNRAYNPSLSSDILEYIYSCIVAGYFYIKQDCPIDIVDFYISIDEMENENPSMLFDQNKEVFKELLGIELNKIEEQKEETSTSKKKLK